MRNKHTRDRNLMALKGQIESLNYDQDFYAGAEDYTMAMQGMDGNYYPLTVVANYDKDFFTGGVIAVPKTAVIGEVNSPTIQQPFFEGGMATPPGGNIAPPSTIKPIAIEPTDGELVNADQFDITVTKTLVGGVLIPVKLPFILFSPVFFQTDYVSLFQNSIPTGYTVSIIELGTSDVRFLFDDGGGNQTALDVSSDITPYRSIINALNTDRFNVVRTRVTIGDTTTIAQVGEALNISNGSLFGGQSFNKLSGAAQKGPDQYQNGIIDFNAKYPLDKYRAIQSFIVGNAPDGFTCKYSFWAKHVIKY